MKISYFTFGFGHEHIINGVVYNKDCVLRIIANDPRKVMLESFGTIWSMEYDRPPSPSLFPRGILDHWDNPRPIEDVMRTNFDRPE